MRISSKRNFSRGLWNWYVVAVILLVVVHAALTALCNDKTAINFNGDPLKNIKSGSIPPFVEQQLKAMAHAENPPPAGLHLSQDGNFFTYASSPSDVKRGGTSAGGYQVTLGRHLSDGIEIFAGQTELSFQFTPMSPGLSSSMGMEEHGRLVYPDTASGIRYEYEFKKNGLKENIILDSAPAKSVNLSFALRKDASLDYKLDTKGNLLVYGPDPVLSGFVQTGDEKSAELIMKARRSAKKDHLLYLIPAPVISDAGGKQYRTLAHYTLENNILTLHTADLTHLSVPITIDPSIVVTTTADFLAGNNEGMISFDTDAISRAVPSGGWIGSWTATTSFMTNRYGHTSVAYNGFLYVIGGYDGSNNHNDVQFAPINANGTIGSWTATASFSTPRRYHTSAVYNGYLYVMGGYTGSDYFNDVQVAPLGADGTVGTWITTTNFPTARFGHASAAFNGYLYVMGGWDGSNFLNDVQVAPINANGTVGTWSATTSFLLARQYHTAAAYNGYFYVTGGYSGSELNDVQYAPINADGTVGFWNATSSFLTARHAHASVACNGYLYVIGGWNGGSYLNDIQVAPINSNGTVGSWNTTTGFSISRDTFASVAYNGYLYVIGGYSGGYLNDVQVAPIKAIGNIGAWNTTASLIVGRVGPTAISYNGYLYVIGGWNGSDRNDVEYAPIHSDGTVGPWSTTSSFATGRDSHTSITYNGYLYIFGGDSGSGYLNDVQFAHINSDGTLGSWSATTSFSTGRWHHSSIEYHGYVYVMGGMANGGGLLNDVQYASINADGTLGSWNTTTNFSTARYRHTSEVYNGYLYVIAGYSGGALNDVQYAPINTDGAIGTWNFTSSLLTARDTHTSVAYNGFIYALGGDSSSGGYLNDVEFAPINADGTLGSWSAATSFVTARFYHASVAYNGYLYVISGYNGSFLNDVQYAFINSSGTVGAWIATTSFPTSREGHASVAYNGYLYMTGGEHGGTMNDVQFAPINPDGTVGTWTATSSFVTGRVWHTAAASNGYLYVMGGWSGSSNLDDVQYAPIHSDGTLGSWNYTANFTTARNGHTSVAYNGYLYVLGGYGTSSGRLNDVQFALINSDGTLNSWSTTTSFITPRDAPASAAYNGYLYILGGYINGNINVNDVQFAPINSNGTLGSWNPATSFDTVRRGHTAAAFNGYLYVMGGYSGSGNLNDVQFAPINSNGTIGSWSFSTNFSDARRYPASVAYKGYVYMIGGYTSSSYLNDVQYSTLMGPASHGAYSKLLDTGPGNKIMESMTFTSSSGGNKGYTLAYAVAPDSSAVFGSRTTIPDAISGTTYTSGFGCARYVWVRFDFDDTNNATIDSGSAIGRKDLLDFTLTYNPNSSIGSSLAAAKTTAVHLTWNPVSGATSYDVQRCNATSGPCTPATIASTTNLYYDDSVLGDASTYWYQIIAGCAGD